MCYSKTGTGFLNVLIVRMQQEIVQKINDWLMTNAKFHFLGFNDFFTIYSKKSTFGIFKQR